METNEIINYLITIITSTYNNFVITENVLSNGYLVGKYENKTIIITINQLSFNIPEKYKGISLDIVKYNINQVPHDEIELSTGSHVVMINSNYYIIEKRGVTTFHINNKRKRE